MYNFNGQKYGAGRLCLAILTAWVKAHPKADLKKLEEVFPHTLIHRYGMWAPLSEAKDCSKIRPRYFLNDADVIEVGERKSKIACCNQLTHDIIENRILPHCKTMGLKVK